MKTATEIQLDALRLAYDSLRLRHEDIVQGRYELDTEREWFGLTREEEAVIIEQWHADEGKPSQLCRMVEAKLEEKNT